MFILTSLSCYWSFLFSALECIFAHCACVCVFLCVVNYQLVPLLFNCYKPMYWIFPAFSLDKLSMHSQTLLSVGREKKMQLINGFSDFV